MGRLKHVWLIMALLIGFTCAILGRGSIQPSQQLLTQCLDEILDFNVCLLLQRGVQEWCCVIYPVNNPRAAYCLRDVYQQLRPPPLPPSIYYTNRRLCGFPSGPCTPMPKLHCPTP